MVIQLIDVRPDIAFALSKISQRQKNPSERDYNALLHVVHYLKSLQNLGICQQPNRTDQAQKFVRTLLLQFTVRRIDPKSHNIRNAD
jgi:hypothetical protein